MNESGYTSREFSWADRLYLGPSVQIGEDGLVYFRDRTFCPSALRGEV